MSLAGAKAKDCCRAGLSSYATAMEFRKLGGSDLQVPVLSFGTATFGDAPVFKTWGGNDVKEATRMVDLCLEAGVTMFDSADIYSAGQAEFNNYRLVVLSKAQ